MNSAINAINTAIKNLKEPVPTEPNPTKQESSKPSAKPINSFDKGNKKLGGSGKGQESGSEADEAG